jgi:predicted  nucleic acid-binding Zn-ribbon protein
MTYKDILDTLANTTAETYTLYLQSRIAALQENDGSLADQIELHRSEYERLDKKLSALLATVKNDESLDKEAPEGFYEDFIK